ncbi:MAG: hypothetical protein E7355_05445 [Clostridiales bacterium]|nr:hypothetical protein [Clostridiales bacterium]
MAKKGRVGKIIGALATVALIGGAAVYGYKIYQDYKSNQPPTTRVQTLKTPNNFAFDSESYVLTWGDVEHADGYTIEYNGTNIEVDEGETSHQILISSDENTFKIKANGDGVNYNDSAWSNTISYTIANMGEATLYEKINIELNRAAKAKGYTLDRVIGISLVQTEYSSHGNVRIEMMATKDGTMKNVIQTYEILNTNNMEEILNSINQSHVRQFIEKNVVSYNSAEELLERGKFAGEMESLRNQGYEISAVDSCVREGYNISGKFRFEIVGTYKATLGNDVKYFTSVNQINVSNPSSDGVYNYETAVRLENKSTVTETQFVMHEAGGTLEYMGKLVC